MTLDADEFIRRFLIHVLPDGFHRIRHYGLLANGNRAGNIALARRLLGVPDSPPSSRDSDGTENPHERQRVERLSLLRRAYDHHRDLRTRLPAAAVAYPTDRARQLMTITPLSPSPITASVRRRYLTGTGHTSPTATVSAAFGRQNLEHRVPDHLRRSHPRRPKPALRWSLNRRPVRNRQIRSSSGGKFPIDRHQRRCELPPRFPPSRLFGRLPPCIPSRR